VKKMMTKPSQVLIYESPSLSEPVVKVVVESHAARRLAVKGTCYSDHTSAFGLRAVVGCCLTFALVVKMSSVQKRQYYRDYM